MGLSACDVYSQMCVRRDRMIYGSESVTMMMNNALDSTLKITAGEVVLFIQEAEINGSPSSTSLALI